MGDDFCIYFERLINGVLVCEEGFSFLANHAILVIINKFRPRRESCVEKVYSELYSWVKSILIAIIIVFICRHFLFSPSIVYGESMNRRLQITIGLLSAKFLKLNGLILSSLMHRMGKIIISNGSSVFRETQS